MSAHIVTAGSRRRFLRMGASCAAAAMLSPLLSATTRRFDVRGFGATGDGQTLDTDAINRAIAAAAVVGGGTVDLPAGRYLCFTLHLRSHVTLNFASGAVLVAATPQPGKAGTHYDMPEPQPATYAGFQDYGHNHWHNSLLWGENLENVVLTGPGELWGRGLRRGVGEDAPGAGNKIIALERCRDVILRDLSLRHAGHFGVLASGVDNLLIDNLRIDTSRDGIDIDSCRDVRLRGCIVNAPGDDAIVLKSSYSLGEIRSTERVTISDCIVTGYFEVGSVLDGSYRRIPAHAPDEPPPFTGRIKIGTETNGDIRNVVVSNCVLQGCHGIAVESVDGGHVEDISFNNITMRDVVGPPIFVRLGARLRGPAGTSTGTIRRVSFRGIDCNGAGGPASSLVSGLPGHPVEDLLIEDVRIVYDGGGTPRTTPVPELPAEYPDPEMFGATPSQGFYVRHARQLDLRGIRLRPSRPDARPALWLEDVHEARIDDVVLAGSDASVLHVVDSTGVTHNR